MALVSTTEPTLTIKLRHLSQMIILKQLSELSVLAHQMMAGHFTEKNHKLSILQIALFYIRHFVFPQTLVSLKGYLEASTS